MARYVFSLALVPVQEWIGEARRARDLRAGSAFLCWAMSRLLAALRESAAADIRIPKLPQDLSRLASSPFGRVLGETYGLPNRAAGYCMAENDEEAARKLGELSGVLAQAWREFRSSGIERLSGDPGWQRFRRALEGWWKAYDAEKGEECPISLVWVTAPLGDEPDLRRDLERVDRLFLEVKRTRPVLAWTAGHPIGKCNQCGRREAIGPTGDFASWRNWHDERSGDEWLARGARLDAGERLCYVCLAKRLASYSGGDDFRSTGEIAASPWIEHVQALPAWGDFKRRVKEADGDLGRALFLSPTRLAETYGPSVTEARGNLFAEAKKLALPAHPPSYLALLTFDGDGMGERVRKDPEPMARAMEEFAGKARPALSAAGAEVFYLAGDEGLAMAPAASALDLALALNDLFATSFEGRATLSIGVSLFEQRQPMAGAIRAARAALARAKEQPNKNALGFSVATASGSRFTIAKPWGASWQRLGKAIALVRQGRLASGFAYDAESFLTGLPAEAWARPSVRVAARAEIRRLFFRRTVAYGATSRERFARRVELWRDLGGEDWWTNEPEASGALAAEPFHLIGFLARQGVPPIGPVPRGT